MKIKIFTFSYDPQKKQFEDGELQKFLLHPNVVIYSNTHHFFTLNGEAIYSFVISYKENSATSITSITPTNDHATNNKILCTEDKVLYENLRLWRSNKSKEENLPAYVFFNNRQLDEIVLRKPKTLKALGAIAGIGKIKTEKHGKEILDIIQKNDNHNNQEIET